MVIKAPTLSQRGSDGFIVVFVLWLLGALGALVSVYSTYMLNTANAFSVYEEQLRGEALVSAALELTAYRYLAAKDHPPEGQFGLHFGGANIAVRFRSEAARIDLNAAPKQVLAGLFRTLGARSDSAESYADRVVAWRTAPRPGQDSDASAYQMAGTGYLPRGASFPHPAELSLVRDLPSSLIERALPFLTVYSGRPQVNVLSAAPEVLAALPGMTPERVSAFLLQRGAAAENAKTLLPTEAQQYAMTDGSGTLRVDVQILFDNGRQQRTEIVMLPLEEGEKPFAVLFWRDDLNRLLADNRQ